MERRVGRGAGFIWGLLSGVVVTVLVAVLGYGVGLTARTETTDEGPDTLDVTLSGNSEVISQEFLQKVTTIENILKDEFYLGEIDPAALREGAYKGMVDALGDVYTVYYTPEEAQKVFDETEGVYYGIGAYVEIDTVSGYVKVTGVIPNSPAEEAGLQSDDIFYKIEGEDLAGLDTSQVIARIKGAEGTTVHLTMVRDGVPFEVDVERRKIESPMVEHSMLEDGMGYIYIAEFSETAAKQFKEALKSIVAEGAEGLIIDVRANPGGSLQVVVEIADMLLGEGLVLYTEDKYGEREEIYSSAHTLWDKPIVLLVDHNSGSASEVLSGALKDRGRATLVGTTTYGKGIVQRLKLMGDGSAVKVTISAYYTPNGINIHGTGIEPDVVVEFDGKAYYGEERFDNQLDKAKEVLREMLP